MIIKPLMLYGTGGVLLASLLFAGVQTLRLSWAQTALAKCETAKVELAATIEKQNDSIARWKMESDRQKALVAQSAVEARSAAQKWQARLAAAESDRPAVTPSDGSFAGCHGSMKWLLDRDNKLHGELNDAK